MPIIILLPVELFYASFPSNILFQLAREPPGGDAIGLQKCIPELLEMVESKAPVKVDRCFIFRRVFEDWGLNKKRVSVMVIRSIQP